MKTLTQVMPPASTHWVGDGFPVQNLISIERDARQSSPFLMLDYAAPYEFKPAARPRGVGEHPHRGFETVTIAYAGEVAHRDSGGGTGVIGPGDVQWMTAGSGVVHEEFHSEAYTRRGGPFSMAQLWVNLPAKDKMTRPRYQTLLDAQIPVIERDGLRLRVIAGEFEGRRGPALVHSPLNVWDVRLKAGSDASVAMPEGWSALVPVFSGAIEVGGQTVGAAQTAHFSTEGATLRLRARADSHLLLLSGQPLKEPIAHYGPFVMNTDDELRETFEDFRTGRFGKLS